MRKIMSLLVLPCLCGNDDPSVYEGGSIVFPTYKIACPACGCIVKSHSYKRAVKKWNKLAAVPSKPPKGSF